MQNRTLNCDYTAQIISAGVLFTFLYVNSERKYFLQYEVSSKLLLGEYEYV